MLAAKSHSEQHDSDSLLIRNMQALMQHHNLNEAKLARIADIPQPTLHKILAGKTTDPRISTLKILADYFNTSVDDLYMGVSKTSLARTTAHVQSIPVISWQDCGKGLHFIHRLTPAQWHQWLVVEFLEKHLYALTTKPSMESAFHIGTTLIIDPLKTPKDGDLVIIHYPNSQEATLRKLTIDGPNQLLAAIHPNLRSDELTPEIKLLGIVIQARYTYS